MGNCKACQALREFGIACESCQEKLYKEMHSVIQKNIPQKYMGYAFQIQDLAADLFGENDFDLAEILNDQNRKDKEARKAIMKAIEMLGI